MTCTHAHTHQAHLASKREAPADGEDDEDSRPAAYLRKALSLCRSRLEDLSDESADGGAGGGAGGGGDEWRELQRLQALLNARLCGALLSELPPRGATSDDAKSRRKKILEQACRTAELACTADVAAASGQGVDGASAGGGGGGGGAASSSTSLTLLFCAVATALGITPGASKKDVGRLATVADDLRHLTGASAAAASAAALGTGSSSRSSRQKSAAARRKAKAKAAEAAQAALAAAGPVRQQHAFVLERVVRDALRAVQ
jgi:hypothetical protein